MPIALSFLLIKKVLGRLLIGLILFFVAIIIAIYSHWIMFPVIFLMFFIELLSLLVWQNPQLNISDIPKLLK